MLEARETRTLTATWNQHQRNPDGSEGGQVPPGLYTVHADIGTPVAESVPTTFTSQGATATPTPMRQTTLPPELMAVPLVRGCNSLVLTYPTGTPIAEFYDSAIPAGAPGGNVWTPTPIVEAIWRFDAATRRFRGWSPAPNAPNDLTTVNCLDADFICVREAGRLVQPALR